jgi:hypothetical protein
MLATTTAEIPHHARRITAAAPSNTSNTNVQGRKLVHAAPTPSSDGMNEENPIPAAISSAAAAMPSPRSDLRRGRRADCVAGRGDPAIGGRDIADQDVGDWDIADHDVGGAAEIRCWGIVSGVTVQ